MTRTRRSIAELLGDPTPLDHIESAARIVEDGDTAIGFAFFERYGAGLCFVPQLGTWFAFSEGVWSPADPETLMQEFAAERVREAAEQYTLDIRRAHDDDAKKAAQQKMQRKTSLFKSRRTQEQAIKQARPHMTVAAARFNRTPHLLGVANGVLNLLTMEMIQAPAREYISKRMGCDYDPKAKAPKWNRFIRDVLPDDAERDFFQRAVGAALFGTILDNGIVFMLGETGDNGKSVACNVLTRLFGDYCMIAGADLLLQTKHDSETKRLYAGLSLGPRLVLINEIPKHAVWDDKKLKDIASRDDLQARRLFGEVFSFTPTYRVFVRGNHAPGAQDNGDAFWKRIWPVTFGKKIPKEKQIPGLDDKIAAEELAGVLNWALAGAAAWREAGAASGATGRLELPESVVRAREHYRAKTDYVAAWLLECTEDAHGASAPRAELWESYKSFCYAAGLRSAGLDRELFEELERRGYVRGAVKGVRVFRGLRLKGERFR